MLNRNRVYGLDLPEQNHKRVWKHPILNLQVSYSWMSLNRIVNPGRLVLPRVQFVPFFLVLSTQPQELVMKFFTGAEFYTPPPHPP